MLHALVYDVHANLPALEAVLADAREAGVERFVLGGDYAFAGAFPEQTMASLRRLDAVWIRGNGERWTNDPAAAPDDPFVEPALAWCRKSLGDELTAELAALPETVALDGVLFCHGSPRSDVETFLPVASEHDEALLQSTPEQVVVFGHSHLQFTRALGDRLLVNPGSAGMPFDGDRRAAYALWRGGRTFELRRVEYDVGAYAAAVRERMADLGEAVETLVRRLESASFAG